MGRVGEFEIPFRTLKEGPYLSPAGDGGNGVVCAAEDKEGFIVGEGQVKGYGGVEGAVHVETCVEVGREVERQESCCAA